jgi:hypothetical protein
MMETLRRVKTVNPQVSDSMDPPTGFPPSSYMLGVIVSTCSWLCPVVVAHNFDVFSNHILGK